MGPGILTAWGQGAQPWEGLGEALKPVGRGSCAAVCVLLPGSTQQYPSHPQPGHHGDGQEAGSNP